MLTKAQKTVQKQGTPYTAYEFGQTYVAIAIRKDTRVSLIRWDGKNAPSWDDLTAWLGADTVAWIAIPKDVYGTIIDKGVTDDGAYPAPGQLVTTRSTWQMVYLTHGPLHRKTVALSSDDGEVHYADPLAITDIDTPQKEPVTTHIYPDIFADILDPMEVPGSPKYSKPDIASYPDVMDEDIWVELIRRDDPDEYQRLLKEEALETYWDYTQDVTAIYTMSTLGLALARWYGLDILTDENIGKTKIRAGLVAKDGWMYYVTGIGYDTIDRDLLGGDGSGATKKRFVDAITVTVTM